MLFRYTNSCFISAASALANNPPACGMLYNELNLARITAVAKMDTSTTCGLCLKVVNSVDTSKFIYVLAVDLGGSGLDVRPFCPKRNTIQAY